MMMDFIIHNKGLVLTSAVVVSQCCGIIDLRRIFRWTKKLLAKSQGEDKKNQELNEVIFFPESPGGLRGPWSKLSRLAAVISGARESVELCLYLVTSPELANTVITLSQTGVAVR